MAVPAPRDRRRATKPASQGELPYRQKILSPRDEISTAAEYYECPRCGVRFDTLSAFDDHRKAAR